jgi:putative FmdB family regulatory protein
VIQGLEREGVEMPTYEYACRDCSKKFSVVVPVSKGSRERVECPKCKSAKVERQYSAFYARTSRKS